MSGIKINFNKKYTIINLLVIVLTIVFVIITSLVFYNNIKKSEEVRINENLSAIATKNTETVKLLFENYHHSLDLIRSYLSTDEDIASDKNILFLRDNIALNNMDSLGIALPNGTIKTRSGIVLNDYFYKNVENLNGDQIFISDVLPSSRRDELVVKMAIPIFDSTSLKAIAALYCEASVDRLIKNLNRSKFYGDGYYNIIDGQGNYVAYTEKSDSLVLGEYYNEKIEEFKYSNGFSSDKIKGDFQNGELRVTKYHLGNEEGYAYHVPIGINSWTMMTVVPSEVVDVQIQKNLRASIRFILAIIFTLTVIFIWIFVLLYNYNKKHKQSNDKIIMLELEQERLYRDVSYGMFDNVLEADITKNCLAGERALGLAESLGIGKDCSFDECINEIAENFVKDEFREEYKNRLSCENILSLYRSGETYFNYEFIECTDGVNYLWTRIEVCIYQNKSTNTIRIISFVKVINDTKEKEILLLEKSQKDSLTNLYNKRTTQELIDERLGKEKNITSALLMIDIDNFKGVNDNLGHDFGDKVIISIAKSMRSVFNKDEILGRVGGDEFAIFVPDYGDKKTLHEKADKLLISAQKKYKGEFERYNFSISIGIALSPKERCSYNELYKNADKALYNSKTSGRNRICYYKKG